MAAELLRHLVTIFSLLAIWFSSRPVAVAATESQHSTTPPFQGVAGKSCYSCTATEGGSVCEKEPSALDNSELSCNHESRTCTTVRVEEWPSRRVKTFYRGCDAKTSVFERNQCIVDRNERTCFTACDGHLCNQNDGLDADREFLRYDNVVPPKAKSNGVRRQLFSTVSAVLMTFPLWVM